MALLDGGGHLRAEGVLDAHQGNEGQVLLHLVGGVLLPAPLLACCTGLEGQEDVPVGYCQQPADRCMSYPAGGCATGDLHSLKC